MILWYGLNLQPISIQEAVALLRDGEARHVAKTMIVTKDLHIQVSTIFLVLDHGWHEGGPPILWETMVFGGPLDADQDRYSSLEDAKVGHEHMVTLVLTALDLEGSSDEYVVTTFSGAASNPP